MQEDLVFTTISTKCIGNVGKKQKHGAMMAREAALPFVTCSRGSL